MKIAFLHFVSIAGSRAGIVQNPQYLLRAGFTESVEAIDELYSLTYTGRERLILGDDVCAGIER